MRNCMNEDRRLINSTNLGQVQASNRQKTGCQNRPPALVR